MGVEDGRQTKRTGVAKSFSVSFVVVAGVCLSEARHKVRVEWNYEEKGDHQ